MPNISQPDIFDQAARRYARDRDARTVSEQPSPSLSGIHERDGVRYMQLENTRGVLARYRIADDGGLHAVDVEF